MTALRHTLLPEPVAPATRTCGILVRSATNGCPTTSTPSGTLRAPSLASYWAEDNTSRRYTVRRRRFGISTPTAPLPGIGARMRMRWARSARARSSSRDTIWLTLTPAAGSNSKVVTTGPGWISVTRPRMSKSASLATSRLASAVRSDAVIRSSCWAGIESRLSDGKLSAAESSTAASASARAGTRGRGALPTGLDACLLSPASGNESCGIAPAPFSFASATAAVMRGLLGADSVVGAGRGGFGFRAALIFGARACASRQAVMAEFKVVNGATNSRRATLAIHGNANSLAASTVTPITAPATTQEPTLPSAAWSASAAASPQPPTHIPRSSPPRPKSVQSSKVISAPSAVRTASGPPGLPRVRFHPQAPDTMGTPKAATRPTAQISPKASRAPTGPQALGALHGDWYGNGATYETRLTRLSTAKAASSTP